MPTKDYKRADRVAELFQMELAVLLQRDIADPRLKNIAISLVKLSDDLGLAKIYFTMLEPDAEKISQALKGLKSASGFLRSHLARVSQLRKVPTLVFYYDEHIDRVDKMTRLIETSMSSDKKYNDL
jgi:ribosome-binding factor A